MTRSAKVNLLLAGGAFLVGTAAALWLVREPTEPLTAEVLREAEERWRQAGVDDYDLRFRMHGSVYSLTVRGGIVTKATVNGRPPQTADLGAYTVEGLFDTLEQELENASDRAGPFAGRSGTVLMRVRFHRDLGYLERYLRSAGGAGRGVAIELIEFVPR